MSGSYQTSSGASLSPGVATVLSGAGSTTSPCGDSGGGPDSRTSGTNLVSMGRNTGIGGNESDDDDDFICQNSLESDVDPSAAKPAESWTTAESDLASNCFDVDDDFLAC